MPYQVTSRQAIVFVAGLALGIAGAWALFGKHSGATEQAGHKQSAAAAIRLGACAVVNIKPGRVGGYLEARRVHDVCQAHGVPAWCGGMLETGLGRAANIAFAALPGCTLTGDVSASDRFYTEDITAPITLDRGHVAVPQGPGLGVEVIPEVLDRFTVSSEWIPTT